MKKICTLLLAAGLVFGAATGASAIDFKAKGQWLVNFDMGGNGNFTAGAKNQGQGWGLKNQDQFNASSRVRLALEAVASENLSGTVHFEIGEQNWGKASDGAALGTDGKGVKVKWAYLDWMVPQTDAKVRMGLQPLSLPSFTTGSQIFNDDVAGVSVSYQFNDNIAASAFWARPYNDNGSDKKGRTGYMDNMDMFALTLPMTFDGVKVTPFAMYAAIGPNTFKSYKDKVESNYNKWEGSSNTGDGLAGLFPVMVDKKAFKNKKITSYGNAWWAGLTADVTVLDPLRIAADFNYGSVSWAEDESLNRAGWLASALVEYKMDWGTPGIVGWYASGDDDNPKNGSERMPVAGQGTTTNGFSNFGFPGNPYLTSRDTIIGKTMVGTWGIGARVKNVSFVEDLKHTLRVNYIGGTNSQKNLKKLGGNEWREVSQYGHTLGSDGYLYMTTKDSAVEFSLTNDYKIYENLTMSLEAAYLATSLNGKNKICADGTRKSVRDPWNINLTFAYSF